MTKITLPTEKQVGHLTLLRQEREISLTEFNALSTAEQLDIVRQRRGKEKYALLTNAKNAAQLVRQLHPQEIYLTINELGPHDSTELLALASPEQVTLLLDLDCWEGDQLSPVLSLRWLELLLGTGEEQACRLVRELEPEILALFLKKHLTILRGIEVYDDDDAENANRLESIYDIDYTSEDAAKVVGALLKIWQEREQDSYLLIMEMIRSEILPVLEEEVFQTRNNRLLDLGIMPAGEAQSLYAYIDPAHFSTGGKTDFLVESENIQNPKALLALAEPYNLLADILAAGIRHETACELVLLVNRKMSADAIDFSAAKQVHEALQSTYDNLNLALEFLAGSDSGKAEEIFTTTYLIRLFQLGHSLLQQRIAKAQKIAAGFIYPYLDYPELLFIDSLLETPACFYRAASADKPSDLRAIRTLKDLQLIDRRLEQISSLEELFSLRLPFRLSTHEEQSEQPSLSQIYITAIANQLLERPYAPAPLSVSDLYSLRQKTIVNDQLDENFRKYFHQQLNREHENCAFFGVFCLELWEDNLLSTEPSETSLPMSAFILDSAK